MGVQLTSNQKPPDTHTANKPSRNYATSTCSWLLPKDPLIIYSTEIPVFTLRKTGSDRLIPPRNDVPWLALSFLISHCLLGIFPELTRLPSQVHWLNIPECFRISCNRLWIPGNHSDWINLPITFRITIEGCLTPHQSKTQDSHASKKKNQITN